MTKAQEAAYLQATDAGYMLAEVMRLCAVGIDHLAADDAATASRAAMTIFAAHLDRVAIALDEARIA